MDRRTMLRQTVCMAAMAAGRALPRERDRPPQLGDLFDRFMQENLDLSPLSATAYGLDTGRRARQKRELDDASVAGIERQAALTASQLARLRAFDRASLSASDATSYDVILYGLRTGDAANRAFHYGPGGAGRPYIISQLGGAYQWLPSFLDTQHIIETRADADAYIARLRDLGTLLDQEAAVARRDLALGVIPPDFALARTLVQMRQLRAPAPDQSPLTTSVVRRAREQSIRGDYLRQASRLVRDRVYPALDRQIALVSDLQQRATAEAGVWRLPDGEAYYAASLANWATTDRKPAQIHELGLELVREQTAMIDTLMRRQGLTQGTVGERLRTMFTDPRYLYPNTDEAKTALIADLNARIRRVRARLPAYFGVLPKAEVEIRRVPPEIESGDAGGSYESPSIDGSRPGIYWINLRDTAEQPRWSLPTVTYHESIPGHHLQGTIQQEANLPLIRKVAFFGAYIEGWALYAEQLAVEMGEYDDDPLGHIGQLHDSLLRAARLVIDTGIHSRRWTREQAIRYFVDTLGEPEPSAVTEVERYCVWPGQACSYMLGKRAFLDQRVRAQQLLGAEFDIRRFHDAMLLPGALPLELLERIYA